MPILAGFHVEGHDHLILRALLAKVLLVPEDEIQVDFIDAPGRRKRRSIQKQRLYGKPVATAADVMSVALPLVRSMTLADLVALTQKSASFRDFHDQITSFRATICGIADCW